jgi:hypothetical protein
MIRAISRIIQARYEQCTLETSSVSYPFCIMKDPRKVLLLLSLLYMLFFFQVFCVNVVFN